MDGYEIDSLNEDQYCSDDDINNNSDVEARLYAEIYYSNNIIGETDNINNPESVTQPSSDVTSNLNLTTVNYNSELPEQNSSQTALNDCNQTSSSKEVYDRCIENSNASKFRMQTSRSEINTENTNFPNPSDNLTGKKQFSTDHRSHEEISRSSKKRKRPLNYNADNEQQEDSVQNSLTDNSRDSCNSNKIAKKSNCKNDQIINPFNRNVLTHKTEGVKLLSTTFLKLLNGKKNKLTKSQRKQKKKLAINDASEENSRTLELICDQNLTSHSVNYDTVNKNNQNHLKESIIQQNISNVIQQNISKEPEIIALSSGDSSEESLQEVTSKFDTIETTEKILKEKSINKNINSDDSTSDSDESIFEVPVPPKPAPPLIDLNDSDKESDSSEDESDDDSSINDTSFNEPVVPQDNTISDHDKETEITEVTSLNETCDIISEGEETNFIFNCTEIQKGVSNINEIKRLSNEASSSSKEQVQEVSSTAQNIDSVQVNRSNKYDEMNTSYTNENTSITRNEAKPSTSLKRKSKVPSERQNIPLEEYFFQPMTEKMKSFYNNSWGGENFDQDELKRNMSSDSRKWTILADDLVFTARRNRRYFGMMCSRCHTEGHRQNQCPEPYKGPTCHMCGNAGHFENRCPHKICLTCGLRSSMYRKTCENCAKLLCSRCHSRGHIEASCPDLWRRYHQTISTNNAEEPKNLRHVMKPPNELFCCNCARRGHDFSSCKKLLWTQHFPNPTYVTSYHGPAYISENPYGSRITNNTILQDSCKRRLANENVSDNPVNTSLNNRKSTDSTGRNDMNSTQFDEKIIFDIKCRKLQSIARKFDIKLNKNGQNVYSQKSWVHLERFLKTFVVENQGHFILKLKNQLLTLTVIGFQYSKACFARLIEQFRDRNSFERSQMYLNFDRNGKRIIEHVCCKLPEINKLTDDPLNLYEEINKLRLKHVNSENDIDYDSENSVELHRLADLQMKLLMILYREGFGDNSLSRLQKFIERLQNRFKMRDERPVPTKKNKRKKFFEGELIKVRQLINFLTWYNNIFTAHTPKNLTELINQYKKHKTRYDKFKNIPSLLSLPKISVSATCTASNKNESEVNVISVDQSASCSSNSQSINSNNVNVKQVYSGLINLVDNAVAQNNDNINSMAFRDKKTNQPSKEFQKHPIKFEPIQTINWPRHESLMKEVKKFNLPHLQKHVKYLEWAKKQQHINVQHFNNLQQLIRKGIKQHKKNLIRNKRM